MRLPSVEFELLGQTKKKMLTNLVIPNFTSKDACDIHFLLVDNVSLHVIPGMYGKVMHTTCCGYDV